VNFLTTQRTLSFFRSVFEIKQLNNTASPICLLIDVDNGNDRITKILFYTYDSSVTDDTQIIIPENIFVYKTIKSDVMVGGWILLTTETLQANANLRFLDLIDTPNSYSGFANCFLRVKSTQDGIEFVPVIGYSSSIIVVDTVDDLINLDTSNLVDYTLAYVKENYTLYLLRRDVVIPSNLTLTEYDVNLIGRGRVVWYNLLNPTIFVNPAVISTENGSGLFHNHPLSNTNIIINKNINRITIFSTALSSFPIDINNNTTSNVFINELNIFSTEESYFKVRNNLTIKNLNIYSLGFHIPGLYLENIKINKLYCPKQVNIEIGGNFVEVDKFDVSGIALLKAVDGLNIRPFLSSQEIKNVYIIENNLRITPAISVFHFYYDDLNGPIYLQNPDNLYYIIFYSDIRGEIPFYVNYSNTSLYPHPLFDTYYRNYYRKNAKLAGLYGVNEFQYEIKQRLLPIEERIIRDKNFNNSCFVVLGIDGFYITPIIRQIYTYTFTLNAPVVNNAGDYYYLIDATSQYTVLIPQSIFDDDRIFVVELLVKYVGDRFTITDTYNNVSYDLPPSSSLRDYSIFRYKVNDDNTENLPLQKFYTLLIGPSRTNTYIKEITINAIAYL
jgi:hypothetical protein